MTISAMELKNSPYALSHPWNIEGNCLWCGMKGYSTIKDDTGSLTVHTGCLREMLGRLREIILEKKT